MLRVYIHVDSYLYYGIYYDTYNYNITAMLLHVVGTQVGIPYTAVRMHVRVCVLLRKRLCTPRRASFEIRTPHPQDLPLEST